MQPATIARTNATIREEFLRRGLASAQELDRVGFVSHETLDEWARSGNLATGLRQLEEAWGLGLLRGEAFNRRIIRTRGGRFGEKPDVVPGANRRMLRNTSPRVTAKEPPTERPKAVIKMIKGTRGGVHGKEFRVYATPPAAPPGSIVERGGMPERMSAKQYREEVTPRETIQAAGEKRLRRLETESRRAGVKATRAGQHEQAARHHAEANAYAKAVANPATVREHGAAELYKQRTTKLEKRIKRSVERHAGERVTPAAGHVRGRHALSAAEIHFNEAGHISQRTLLAYAEEAATQPTTAEMYRDKQGNYHPSRAALHADIIDKMLREPGHDDSGSETGLSATAPYLKKPDGPPTVVFTGGGYASGKGSVIKLMKARGEWPEGAMQLDPDLIKAELPEFQLAATTDPEANLRVYSEAWDIAQEAMRQAQERGLNVVVDGLTNTSADEVAYRVKSFTDAGYINPRIEYVSTPTEIAIQRAQRRAEQGATPDDKRMIPEVIMRAVHRDVSATIPVVMSRSKEMGATINVYDTNQGTDEITGQHKPAKLLASASPEGGITHHDPQGFQSVLHKANEPISGVPDITAKPTGAEKPGTVKLDIDPVVERQIGQNLAAAWPETPGTKPPQPTSDPSALLTTSQVQTLPAYKALLDMGQGISKELDAITEDIDSGKSFGDVGDSIRDNMDRSHVIIAPVKSLKRALEKAAADGMPGDLSGTHDTVRATVTVPTAQDLPGAVDKIVKAMQSKGWKIERAKPRLINANGGARSGENGYGDLTLYARAPDEAGNVVTELQINTNAMWWAKEVGMGHDFYVQERAIRDGAAADGQRELTPDESKLIDELRADAKPLYDRAWGLSLNGGGDANVGDVVMGDQTEREMIQRRLKELSDRVAALRAA